MRAPPRARPVALNLEPRRERDAPALYRQIFDATRGAVLTGELAAGDRLPPERDLANRLGVNRTTVIRAYSDLATAGVVEARPGRGTLVRAPTPATRDQARSAAVTSIGARDQGPAWLIGLPPLGRANLGPDAGLLSDLAGTSGRPGLISFALGTPSPDVVPRQRLQEELVAALDECGAAGLGYGPVEGLPTLKATIAGRLAQRRVIASPEQVLVVSGATQGIALIAQSLIEPGDEVAVESPTYIGALQTFAAAGARLIGVPVDGKGVRVDLLESVLSRRRIRLLFLQPTHHNPTGTTVPPERREQLLAPSWRYGVPIVEDDAYGELWHEPPDPFPLKASDRHELVIHLSTFSKTVAPGLRVGYVAGPAALVRRLALAKQFSDLNTSALSQLALARFLAAGEYERHLHLVRAIYALRWATMLAALSGLANIDVSPHSKGGFYLWCRLDGALNARQIVAAAARRGVTLIAGEAFFPPGSGAPGDSHRWIRLSFSSASPEAIVEGIARLAVVLRRQPISIPASQIEGTQPLV